MIYLPWAAEFILECSGAYLAYRKRLKLLSALLAWRAVMDVVTFIILKLLHLHHGYGFTMWAGRAIQYTLLYALGVQIAKRMVEDYRPTTRHRYMVIAIGVSVATWVFVTTELWEHKFIRAELVSSFLLLAVVLLGWIGRKKGLEEPWRLIGVGIIAQALGNSICAIVSSSSSVGQVLYPIPAILALLIWNWSVLPKRKRKLTEFRPETEKRFEPTGVYRELSRRVQ